MKKQLFVVASLLAGPRMLFGQSASQRSCASALPAIRTGRARPSRSAGQSRRRTSAASIRQTIIRSRWRTSGPATPATERQAVQPAEAGQHEHRQESQPQVDDHAHHGLRSDRHGAGGRGGGGGGGLRRRTRRRRRRTGHADHRRRAWATARRTTAATARRAAAFCSWTASSTRRRRSTSTRSTRATGRSCGTTTGRRAAAPACRRAALGMWRNYIYFDDARQLGRVPRRQDRQGSLAARDRPARSAVLLVERPDGDRRPRARRHRQRPRRARRS